MMDNQESGAGDTYERVQRLTYERSLANAIRELDEVGAQLTRYHDMLLGVSQDFSEHSVMIQVTTAPIDAACLVS